VAERWRLVVRDGATVRKSIWPTLADALDQLQAETVEASNRPPAQPVDLKVRDFTPRDLVVMRAGVKGPQRLLPKVRCGMDVRGDGSAEPWIGGAGKREVEVRRKETPWLALRRELGVKKA
jgi:hypothetical protein